VATSLIVEDGPNNRWLLDSLLKHAGHVVGEPANGAEALSFVARRKPDLIIVDLSLPDISGVELIRKLRSASATVDCPIALYTATQSGPAIDELIDALTAERMQTAGLSCAVLGTFCAIDSQPRAWSDADLAFVREMAASAMTEIELFQRE